MTEAMLFHTLSKLGDGEMVDELSEGLQNVINAVKRTHKKGKITITITVKPNKERGADVHQVIMKGEVSPKPPSMDHGGEIFFLDDNNRLTTRNPRQPAVTKMPPPEEMAGPDGKSRAAGEKA